MRQVRLKIDTSFAESKNAAKAVEYLNSGEILLRDGLEIALSCMFSPIAAAAEGASLSEIKQRCEVSRTQFETYMNLAMSRAEVLNSHSDKVNEIDITETTETIFSEQSNSEEAEKGCFVSNDEEEIDDDDVYINFEGEEF